MFAATLAAVATLAMVGPARADFSYSTAIAFDPTGTGSTSSGVAIAPVTVTVNGEPENGFSATLGGTTISMLGANRGGFSVPGISTLSFADIKATTTTSAANPLVGDTFDIGYTLSITLTNSPPPGSAASRTLSLSGRLSVINVNVGSGEITNLFFAPNSGTVNFGGISLTGAVNQYAAPTINDASFGSISGRAVAAVPEPGSLALLGLGGAGLAAMYRRKAKAKA